MGELFQSIMQGSGESSRPLQGLASPKLNEKKCNIRKPKINYFGNGISKEGVSPDPGKFKAIQELPAPKNVPELRQVLGMINYLGKGLPNLSLVISPMSELLNADST